MSANPPTMPVVEYDRYGGPDVLKVREATVPHPREGEVLVRVAGASVSGGEAMIREGRLRYVMRQALPARVGVDFAGVVELVVGDSRVVEGDRVWGVMPHSTFGAMAGFVAVPASRVARVPEELDLVDAAAAPAAGTTAAHALRDVARLQPGESLLVRGASGGVGHVAVQLGHRRGAQVTALVGPANLTWAEDLGADLVLDHRRTSVEDLRAHAPFDVIVDVVGSDVRTLRGLLGPRGRIVPLAMDPARPVRSLAAITASGVLRRGQVLPFSNDPRPGELDDLAVLVARGDLKVAVHQRFDLARVADAYRCLETGGVRGKVVVGF